MSQKEKLLNSAQKFIQKGQVDRAIADYEKVVALDPRDFRNRQKLAELLVRANRRDDAVREYCSIAGHYADNAFYLKAIAVYKQVQRIDPQNTDLLLRLAELNEKQGLKGNALAEYKNAVDQYARAGNPTEAVKVLDRMLTVDPGNVSIQIKKAEVLLSASLTEKAYQEYLQAAAMLEQKKDQEGLSRLVARVRGVFPDRSTFILDLAEEYIRSGNAAAAIREMQRMVKSDQTNLKAWKVLCSAYSAAGERSGLEEAARAMAKLFPAETSGTEALLGVLLDGGRIEEGIDLVRRSQQEGASPAVLEGWYKSLLEKAPADLRVLQGLQHVYRALDQKKKLSDIDKRIELVSRNETVAPTPSPIPAPTPAQVAAEARPAAAATVNEPQGGSWEEELDLSLDEEFTSFYEDETAGAGAPVDEAKPPQASSPPPAEVAVPDFDDSLIEIPDQALPEIDLEFDAPLEVELLQDAPDAPEPADALPEIDLHDLFLAAAGEESAEVSLSEEFVLDGLFSDDTEKELESRAEQEDTETHYNLGIAYREMGLYADAVVEFERAGRDPSRRVAAMTLQGLCYRDKEEFEQAEKIFRNALDTCTLSTQEEAGLCFELAVLCETTRRDTDALEWYTRAESRSPGFHDAQQRIARLKGGEEELPEIDLEDAELEFAE